MNLAVQWEGLVEFEQRLRALASASGPVKALAGAAYQRGQAIMAVSQRLVPVDTGALRSSGHVEAPKISASKVQVDLVYGGAAAPYARIVHEDLDAFHKVGQAKYLEEPFLAERDGVLKEFVQVMRREFGRRGRKAA